MTIEDDLIEIQKQFIKMARRIEDIERRNSGGSPPSAPSAMMSTGAPEEELPLDVSSLMPEEDKMEQRPGDRPGRRSIGLPPPIDRA